MRDKIIKILEIYRNSNIGNIALANIIVQSTKSLNNLTTEPLSSLLIENGEKCYEEVGNLCEVKIDNIKIGEKVYAEIK